MCRECCDKDCNNCEIIKNKNSRILTKIFNDLHNELGNKVYEIVQRACPNLTVCYDCRIDDFCHVEGCEFIEE